MHLAANGHLTAVGAALGAALLVAAGFVLQQHAAAQEPPSERLTFRLLAHLVHRPVWLGGIACMVAGQLLGALALDRGSLALVEPFMASNLLFALPLSAAWHRRRIGGRDYVAAALVVAGLAFFVAAGDPFGGSTARIPWPSWLSALGAVGLASGLAVLVGRTAGRRWEVTFLGGGAGILFGMQDALTQRVETLAGKGLLALVTHWPVFLLVAVGVLGLLINQSAFEGGPLSASLPSVTVGEPLTGIALGVGLYREHLDLTWPGLVIEIAGLAAMGCGVIMLASSPLVAGAGRPRHPESRNG